MIHFYLSVENIVVLWAISTVSVVNSYPVKVSREAIDRV
jgi:hypothetical protein